MRVIARRLAAGSVGMLCGLLVLTAAPDPAAAQSSPANKANKTALQQLKSERDYCYAPKSSIFVDWFPVFAGTAEKQKSVTPADMRRMVLVTGDRVEVIGNEVRFTSAAGVVVSYVYVECNWANYPQYREAMTRYKDTGVSPTASRIELGVTAGRTGSNQNVNLNTSFDASGSGSAMDSANVVGFDARFIIPVAPGGVNVFGGYTFRTYTNEKGQLVLDLHIPTAGNDTFLTYKPDNSHTVFGGVGIPLVGRNVIPNIDEAAMNLYIGYRHMTGDITGSTNETGGGGIVNPLGGSFSQNGMVFGAELNFRTSAFGFPVIFGAGVDVAKLGGGSFSTNSTLNFNYNVVVQDRTETTGYLRAAVPLCLDNNFTCRAAGTLSDIRLKRDIALLGKRADGIALYRYRYWWSDTDHVGVMAQEVAQIRPDAVSRGADGFLRVDYGTLGTRLMTFAEWSTGQTRLGALIGQSAR